MLDLSNNNGAVNFRRVYDGGTRRVYLKLTEGATYMDPTAHPRMIRAQQAGLKTGFYHFGRPSKNDAEVEAKHFIRCLPPNWKQKGHLRPCLDLEDPHIKPGKAVERWATDFLYYFKNTTGIWPLLYGNTYYLQACGFGQAVCPLWLASYGRNDGKEHPYVIPAPWTPKKLAAHQYASTAHVAGVEGEVDISHVFKPRLLDLSRWSR